MSQAVCLVRAMTFTPLGKMLAIGTATAFIWRRGDELFLITNLHVATGRNYLTGKSLNRDGHLPQFLMIESSLRGGGNPERKVPLCNVLIDGKPAWFEHPTLGSKVDMCALRIVDAQALRPRPINEIAQEQSMGVYVGTDCFVLGYPLGDTYFPIWKRGTIASEPLLTKIPGIHNFYIDSATRSGMSGSPVILFSRAGFLDQEGRWQDQTYRGVIGNCRFIGIYSSREPADATALQLGVVFPAHLVEEMVAAIPSLRAD